MSTRELDRQIETNALREIERALRGRLKAYGLSGAFIDRTAEDAVQKGWEEYLRSLGRGKSIENPGGFVVRAGFFRAIDELRREGREADGLVLDALIDSGGAARASEPSTEEAAITYVRAEEVREAVEQLSSEDQRVLSLHYFEELSAQASAAALFCSERTYRRRLKVALRKLCRILDAPLPEPGSELAVEIGLAVWVGLRGADVALAHGFSQTFLGLFERGREGADWMLDRLRGPVTRLDAGGGSEKIGAIASGPFGKVAGGCAGAAAVCLLGGAIGAGVSGSGDLFSDHDSPPPHLARRAPDPRPGEPKPPALPARGSQPTASPPPTRTQNEPSPAQRRRLSRRADQRQLKEQFSATARIESESSPASSASAASAPDSATVTPSGTSSPSGQASEEAQAEQQFGAFK